MHICKKNPERERVENVPNYRLLNENGSTCMIKISLARQRSEDQTNKLHKNSLVKIQ